MLGHKETVLKCGIVMKRSKYPIHVVNLQIFSRNELFCIFAHLVYVKALVLRIPTCYVFAPDNFYEVNYDLGGLWALM